MSIFRVRTTLSGFTGGPGLMTQYFSTAAAGFNEATAQLAVDRVRDALQAGSGLFSTNQTWSVSGSVDVLDEASGQMTNSIGVTARSGAGTAGGGIGPTPVGVAINWKTSEFKNGRRVQGRTFLVPVSGGSFEGDGTLSATALAEAAEFHAAMRDAGATDLVLVVWSRPNAAGAGGSRHGVTSASVADKAAVLRSRRD